MGIAVIGFIVLAIPLIAAVVGRSTIDEDPNKTGDPEDDRNVEPGSEDPNGGSGGDRT